MRTLSEIVSAYLLYDLQVNESSQSVIRSVGLSATCYNHYTAASAVLYSS